jgi:phosphoenolpyruvate-protein kinase (PTS system EI component)
VVAFRASAIPAVVGTSDATRRIKTGDRIRVNGSTGRVDILADGGKPARKAGQGSLLHT